MVIPKKPKTNEDDFIKDAIATKADRKKGFGNEEKKATYLLSIDADLRRVIRVESIEKGYKNMSEYICEILRKR